MSQRLALGLVIGLLLTGGANAAWSWDFESGTLPSEFTGAGGVTGSGGYSAYGFGNYFVRSSGGAVALTLTGLPSHNSIDLNFLFAAIDSWDGNTTVGGAVPPDYFNVAVDGIEIFQETFDFQALSDQSYVAPSGGQLVWGSNIYGLSYTDAAYDMGLDATFDGIAHSASTLTITWWADGSGWQSDESFAIDNVEILLNGTCDNTIPAPGALLLAGLGTCLVQRLRGRGASSLSL